MNNSKLLSHALGWTIACLFFQANLAADDSLSKLKPFLQTHCVECHGPKRQENDLRFDSLGADLTNKRTLEIWQDIVDQINRGDMPPKDRPRPDTKALADFVDSLTATLKQAYAAQRSTGAQTVIRRLNRYELRNTLRDLLYLDGAAYRPGAVAKLVDNNGNGRVERKGTDPVRAFPEDENEAGFVNIGDRLVMSDFLLKLTMQAAQETLQDATHTERRPNVEPQRFAGHIVSEKQYGQFTLETVSRELNPDFDMIVQRYQRFGRMSPTKIRQGVRTSARYRITVEASGHNQKHPWGELIKNDQNAPFLLGLHMADTANGGISGPTSTSLVQWKLPGDGSKKTFQFETWIDDTWTIWLGWENGPYDRQFQAERVVEKYMPKSYKPRPDRKTVDKKIYDQWPIDMARQLLKSGYKGPHLRIYSVTLEPLIDAWPPQSHTALYGTQPPDKVDVEKQMLAFAQRAFRRPVSAKEIEPYVALTRRLMSDPKEKPGGPIKDLRYKIYKGKWPKLPEFDKLEPVAQGSLANGLLDIGVSQLRDYFAVVFEGELSADKKGKYEFEIASDDGSRVLVDGKRVIEHDGLHGASTKKGSLDLDPSKHTLRVEYFAYGLPNSLQMSWRGPGFNEQLSVANSAPKQLSVDARTAKVIQALQAGYTAMLCSPRFLYIKERAGPLDHYDIASRLSYFLWSSMPDDRLIELAGQNKMTDKRVLAREVERMLNDPKAAAFMHNFTVAWLRLDKLGKMPPEKGGPFRFYHDRKVEPMMVSQTTAYFADLVRSNGAIDLFIDSDYTFMNETLATWIYKRDDVFGERMQKVALHDRRRGGIFTHPSVMTATANGVDTSPVVRGVYVLENILGTPPSPPPPDVEPLSPDLSEAKTIRQQLELHRKHQACNSCHRKIDPMGFAMENFNPVGQWRDKYPKARDDIDASATLSNGQEVADIVEFKAMLMDQKDLVTRCLTEKLLTYASGRRLEPTDRGEVDEIVAELAKRGNGVRDLIQLVVQSELFLTK